MLKNLKKVHFCRLYQFLCRNAVPSLSPRTNLCPSVKLCNILYIKHLQEYKQALKKYFASGNKSSKLKYYSITRKQSETTGTCESYKYNLGCFRLVLLHTDIFEIQSIWHTCASVCQRVPNFLHKSVKFTNGIGSDEILRTAQNLITRIF